MAKNRGRHTLCTPRCKVGTRVFALSACGRVMPVRNIKHKPGQGSSSVRAHAVAHLPTLQRSSLPRVQFGDLGGHVARSNACMGNPVLHRPRGACALTTFCAAAGSGAPATVQLMLCRAARASWMNAADSCPAFTVPPQKVQRAAQPPPAAAVHSPMHGPLA